MCTLTYLPLPGSAFILTSNRDESPHRPKALPPKILCWKNMSLMYPVDGQAGGTWIAAADNRRCACLLNGAFIPHQRQLPYRLSRGVMVLESFEFATAMVFYEEYDFNGIEPFTYVSFETDGEKVMISELRWDGQERFVNQFDPLHPHIWSSASLYTPETIAKREQWFFEWLEQQEFYEANEILQFHQFGGEGDIYNDIKMNRMNLVKTISITSVINRADKIIMRYQDLLNNTSTIRSLVPSMAE